MLNPKPEIGCGLWHSLKHTCCQRWIQEFETGLVEGGNPLLPHGVHIVHVVREGGL